jgi:aminotransferase
MIKISKVANRIQPSLTRKLFNLAKQYDDVIDLTLGDPDVPTPLSIKEAGCAAIMKGKTRYSQNAGLLELRNVISKYVKNKEQIYYDPLSEIMVTVGAMEALYLTLLSTIDEGDEIIIPAPYYVNYKQMVEMCGGKAVIVEDTENKNTLSCSLTAIERAITGKTVAIILNTPCNPSGKVMTPSFIEGIAKIAQMYDLLIVTDEVYKCLIYDQETRPQSIANLPNMKERTVFINSLSKEFCMTGWRLGYAMGPQHIIAAMTKLQENVAACAPLPSQYAAIEALRTDIDYSANMRQIFLKRRNILVDGFSNIPKLKCIIPEATFYAMVNINETGMKSEAFAYTLLEKTHVAVVPGITYGMITDDYIRIAFTLSESKLKEGILKIKNFMINN